MPIDRRDPRLATLAPVVLVGGRSRRFGRDKLQETVAGRRLVEHPIAALREVFGPRVAIVGDCDLPVRAAGDVWVPDEHPGIGPMGGIATALRRLDRAVLVLAGDMPAIDAATVLAIAEACFASPPARIVLATTGDGERTRRHPCAAIYTHSMQEVLGQAIRRERFSLLAAIDELDPAQVTQVACEARCLANINEPSDVARLLRSV
jgi:molybdenum cofactor guanylyltransferase